MLKNNKMASLSSFKRFETTLVLPTGLPKLFNKSIGFTVPGYEHVEKALVGQYRATEPDYRATDPGSV